MAQEVKEVEGVVSVSKPTGFLINGSWANKSQYGKYTTPWDSVQAGDYIKVKLVKDKFVTAFEIIKKGTGSVQSGKENGSVAPSGNKEAQADKDRAIARSVVVYAVFQSEVTESLLKEVRGSQKLTRLADIADAIQEFLFNPDKDAKLSESLIKKISTTGCTAEEDTSGK